MKTKCHTITAAVIALTIFTQTSHGVSGLPAPKPCFLSQNQLAKWNEEQSADKDERSADLDNTMSKGNGSFFTGKPFDSGFYLFKYRTYDLEINRWTTPDPSGFPDGANNQRYTNAPTQELDALGLENKRVALLYGWYDPSNQTQFSGGWHDSDFHNYIQSQVPVWISKMNEADAKPDSTTHYLDDGDSMEFGAITNWSQLSAWSTYDKVILVAHGSTSVHEYFIDGAGMDPSSLDGNVVLWGCNPTSGAVSASFAGSLFFSAAETLLE